MVQSSATTEDFAAEIARSYPVPRTVNVSSFDVIEARRRIEGDGYAIVRGLVDPGALADIRRFWLAKYAGEKPKSRVVWSPYLGQENVIGFSNDSFQKLFRSCDFLWNAPFEPLSREICVQLNRMRNLILDMPMLAGEIFTQDRYGIFVTTSYYPPDGGWMKVHSDGVSPGKPLLHHIVPLTYKGIDYHEGGMVVVDRHKRRIDVDAQLTPGDVVFYDGSLVHGVDPIVERRAGGVGRLQMFAIPTLFTNIEEKQHLVEKVSYRALTKAKLTGLKLEVLSALHIMSRRP